MKNKEIAKQFNQQAQAYRLVVAFLQENRQNKKKSSKTWEIFRKKLEAIKLQSDQGQAIELWVLSNLEQHNPRLVLLRILHPQEAPHFSKEAYGLLLEACSVGTISIQQMEWIMEDLGQRLPPPVSADYALQSVLEVWNRNFEQMLSVRAN